MILTNSPPKDQLLVSRFVDHELAVNLDSTDAFEGPEKLLELWFGPSASSVIENMTTCEGLRAIPREQWQHVLDLVQCKIISVVSNDDMDAYVLSESSMFVFPHKMVLKTCGTTTLLLGIDELLDTVETFTGYSRSKQPWKLFYSRKSFMFPERQQHPHQDWRDEVKVLDSRFKNGCAYMVGNISADHWYLYTTKTSSQNDDFLLQERCDKKSDYLCDETFEIMMTDLSPTHASQFYSDRLPGARQQVISSAIDDSAESPDSDIESSASSIDSSMSSLVGAPADDDDPGHELGNMTTKYSGIDQIYCTDKQIIDSFLFTPCGYSCNGIVENGHYFTIHVTPEKHCSYASFETTVPSQKFGLTKLEVLERVVNIFRPGKFSMTLFQSFASLDSTDGASAISDLGLLSGYNRTERILYELDGYQLLFVSFEAVGTDKALKARGLRG